MKIYPVIMCGGYGSRLWPLSRLNLPKQFLKIFEGRSLFQKAITRVSADKKFERPVLVSSREQKYLLKDQLDELGFKDLKIFLEPIALSTAPVATIAALNIYQNDPDALMFLLSSDSEIKNEKLFLDTAIKASEIALKEQKYVLFGSKPQYPETGYGYIQTGETLAKSKGVSVKYIDNFIEKPSLENAKKNIESGCYWNSGIFIIPVKLFVSEISKFSPEIFQACTKTLAKSNYRTWGNYDLTELNEEEFKKCPEDSIDYAVMEKTKNSAVVEIDMGWYDVGSWQTLHEISPKDDKGNFISGNILTLGVNNSNIYSSDQSRMTAVLDVDNLTVVQTNDATLVMPTEKSQDVKKIVKLLQANKDNRFLKNSVDHRSWGYIEDIRKEAKFALYKIFIKANSEAEFDGNKKFKHFIVTQGEAIFYIGRAKFLVKENDSLLVPKNIDFRIINNSDNKIEVLKTETKDYEKVASTSKKIAHQDF